MNEKIKEVKQGSLLILGANCWEAEDDLSPVKALTDFNVETELRAYLAIAPAPDPNSPNGIESDGYRFIEWLEAKGLIERVQNVVYYHLGDYDLGDKLDPVVEVDRHSSHRTRKP